MSRKRLPDNKGLPARWTTKHGAYYYLPPPAQRPRWDGKAWFRLGATLAEAYKVWAERIEVQRDARTVSELFDRYLIDELPKKAAKTATENRKQIAKIRTVFGAMLLDDITPQHIYQYVDRRMKKLRDGTLVPAPVAAHREVEVLSHALTKAVQWGYIKKHPTVGQVRLEGEPSRDRYVEDWELMELLAMPSRRKKGSVGMIQAYLRLKLLTGLRQRDLLLLTVSSLKDDGIHVHLSKTRKTTGKRVIYEWTPELRTAVEQVKAVRPALSPFLFCNRYGVGFVDEETGKAKDWANMWQKCMARLLKETKVTERFTEHDLRAKVGSDAESLERARQLLSHADAKTTQRVYRRRPERVKPVR